MDRQRIEKEARRIQFEIWSERELIWPTHAPAPERMFDPEVVARKFGLELEVRDRIEAIGGRQSGMEAAGLLDRGRGIIAVSAGFKYQTQRFTAAHELGHFVLHPWIGERVVHRDRPVFELADGGRPVIEQEADYFAACLLVYASLLVKAFEARFGGRRPLPLTETVAFHLAGAGAQALFDAPRSSLAFASAVARAQSFDGRRFPSLADHFGVSVSAMAIRLREVGLVVD